MRQKRASHYRCSPTPEQANVLARTVGSARFVDNWALRLRTDASCERQERLSYADPSAALTVLKREPDTAWLNEVSSVPIQQVVRHLDRAFGNFFAGRAKILPAARSTAHRQRRTRPRPSAGRQLPSR